MKLFGYDINFNRIQNIDVKRPDKSNVIAKITTPTQLYRVRQDVATWRAALTSAESVYNPQRLQLYRLYNDLILDAHLSACIDQRKNLIRSLDFDIKINDEENEELSKLIETKWFRDFVDYALDSIYFGYSLIQFDSIVNDSFKCVELVPRQYVKPELHIVTTDTSAITGTDYLEFPYNNWSIGVGNPKDLGLLAKAAPLIIWKKNALASWAEFGEIFGTPLRVGKTDLRDEVTVNNMEKMLQNMKSSAYGLFNTDDEIEFVETNRSDAHQVFDAMIQRCNSEISKLILNQTGTTDEKSFVGSAEIQERILKNVGYNDQFFIETVCNTQLVPMMQRLGLLPEGAEICIYNEESFSIQDQSKFDIELLKTGKFMVTPEYIKEKYGTDVIEVAEPDNSISSVQNKLNDLYK